MDVNLIYSKIEIDIILKVTIILVSLKDLNNAAKFIS